MKNPFWIMGLCLCGAVSAADDSATAIAPAVPTAPVARARPAAVAPVVKSESAAVDKASSAADAPKFASEAKWGLAGYNNNEVYYSIFVTNQDPRIIRCTTEIKGFYFDNGEKLSIADRQVTTVFPNQLTQVGIWMDMDENSGATYSVKCHPI